MDFFALKNIFCLYIVNGMEEIMKGAIKLMIVGFLFCARFVLLAKI